MPIPCTNPLLSLLLLLLLLLCLSMIPSLGYTSADTSASPSPAPTSSPVSSTSCASYMCGKFSISYPFYLSDALTLPSQYCGYPGMGVFCYHEETPILLNENGNYTITGIDYTSRTISLADTDVLNSRNLSCHRVRHNFTFFSDSTLNYTSSDTNLTFVFNCSPLPEPLFTITCLSETPHYSYVFPPNETPSDYFSWVSTCQDVVVVPVLNKTLNPSFYNALPTNYGPVIQDGFQLTWNNLTTDYCNRCDKSGGRCGFNQPTGTSWVSACFCQDGMHTGDCGNGSSANNGDKKGKHSGKGIIIGASVGGAALAAILLLCLAFVLYRRKKKRSRSPSSNLLTRSSLSDPYYSKDLEDCSFGYQTHLFSYEELEEATNRFDSSKELGSGGFGNVYKGKLRDGRTVAIKRLYENNYNRMDQFFNEVSILSRLRHPNLVLLYGCTSRQSRQHLLVYEYVPNGTVADHLHGSRAAERVLTWPVRLNIAIETAEALAYLHAVEPPIIHRDVKSNNILLDGNYHVKVGDFGLSRLFPLDVTHVSTAPQGTPGYVDPEYHKCYQLTDKSDVYSLGVVLVELISSKPAVDLGRRREEINLSTMAINKIQKCELDQLVDPELGYESDWATKKAITMVAELAFRCLQPDGDMRPPVKEVLEGLTGILKEGYYKGKDGEVGMDDDDGLLKNIPPSSPDTVTAKWVSNETTPNTSS